MAKVACRFPNGLIIETFDIIKNEGLEKLGNRTGRVTLNGANKATTIAGIGLTEVDDKLWAEWLEQHRDAPYVRDGFVFEYKTLANAEKEVAIGKPTGLEPIDQSKHPKNITKADS